MSEPTSESKSESQSKPGSVPEIAPAERKDVLARIETYKRREIAEAKLRVPLAKLERRAAQAVPVRGFAAAIRSHLDAGRPALIA